MFGISTGILVRGKLFAPAQSQLTLSDLWEGRKEGSCQEAHTPNPGSAVAERRRRP